MNFNFKYEERDEEQKKLEKANKKLEKKKLAEKTGTVIQDVRVEEDDGKQEYWTEDGYFNENDEYVEHEYIGDEVVENGVVENRVVENEMVGNEVGKELEELVPEVNEQMETEMKKDATIRPTENIDRSLNNDTNETEEINMGGALYAYFEYLFTEKIDEIVQSSRDGVVKMNEQKGEENIEENVEETVEEIVKSSIDDVVKIDEDVEIVEEKIATNNNQEVEEEEGKEKVQKNSSN